MPFNSFENYPMSWKPERDKLKSPLHLSIQDLLEEDIQSGRLAPYTKLPPQRELADYLDVNLSTITRAFKACELRGLIYATTGKGTFVSPGANKPNVLSSHEDTGGFIDMGIIKPFYGTNPIVLDATKAVLNKPGALSLLEYAYPLGSPYQLKAAKKWMAGLSLDVSEKNIVISAGGQNALTVVLTALFKPGQKIAADMYTHPNMISLANMLNIQLIPIPSDTQGMSPEALDTVCKNNLISGVYLMPAHSNPTGVTIPAARRKELAGLIKKHRLTLIEDDIYAFLKPQFEPVSSMVPENSVYVCSTSKALCAGLRVGFIAFPDAFRSRIVSGVYNIHLKTPSLNAEVVADMILNGTAEQIVAQKTEWARERNRIFGRYFPALADAENLCFFRWVPLPENINGALFENSLRSRGVGVLCSERFAIGDAERPAYVRLALSSPTDAAELNQGLQIIQSVLKDSADAGATDFIV